MSTDSSAGVRHASHPRMKFILVALLSSSLRIGRYSRAPTSRAELSGMPATEIEKAGAAPPRYNEGDMDLKTAPPHPSELPILRFPGEIRVVDRPEGVEPMARDLAREPLLGFDTETRPTFLKGQKHLPALVQLATADRAYIIQLRRAGFTAALIALLSDPKVLKIGVGVRDDLTALQQLSPFMPQGFVDLGDLAKSKGIAQRGARSLTARFLQGRLSKSVQTSNWAVKDLSERQKTYAATDAWVCLRIYPLLLAEPSAAESQAGGRE